MNKLIIPLVLTAVSCSSLAVNQKAIRFGLHDGKVVLRTGQAEDIIKEGFLLELKPGDKLTLAANISGDFVALEEGSLTLTVTRQCYLYSHQLDTYFSINGVDFHSFRDFFRGSMGLQFDVKKNAPVKINWRLQVMEKAK